MEAFVVIDLPFSTTGETVVNVHRTTAISFAQVVGVIATTIGATRFRESVESCTDELDV